MDTKIKSASSLEEIIKAFEFFDEKKTGFIDHLTLRHCMTHFLPKLSEMELKELFKVADPKNTGKVDYKNLLQTIVL